MLLDLFCIPLILFLAYLLVDTCMSIVARLIGKNDPESIWDEKLDSIWKEK